MVWNKQVTSNRLKQCWPSFLKPYGVPRGQWVKSVQHIFTELLSNYRTLSNSYKNESYILLSNGTPVISCSQQLQCFWISASLVQREWYIPDKLGRYQGCWCSGSLRRQVISSHDIDCERCGYSCLPWEWISTICDVTTGLDIKGCPHAQGMSILSLAGHINFYGYVPNRASDSSFWAHANFPSSIHQLFRACTTIGWAHGNFCCTCHTYTLGMSMIWWYPK